MTYIIHGWETPSADRPASVRLKLEGSLCHIRCVQNHPTSTSVAEMSERADGTFGLQLPSETFPLLESQDMCKCVLAYTYMNTHVQAQAQPTQHTQGCAAPQPNTTLSAAVPRDALGQVALQKSYKNVISLWREVGISSESRTEENCYMQVKLSTQRARYTQTRC